jgi:hypothetical protein
MSNDVFHPHSFDTGSGKQGQFYSLPALESAGIEFIGKPEAYGRQKRDEYTEKIYHKPADKPDPAWDLSGAVEDLRVLFETGYRVAQEVKIPEWKPGNEFKARRDAMMK